MLYIFDKDNTLIGSYDGRPANTIAEQHLLPGVAEKCAELRAQGHKLAVASNQGGVAWGFITLNRANALVTHAASLVEADGWRVCPHHPKGCNEYAVDCDCRKPKPGMLLSLMEQFKTGPEDTVFIGDTETDRKTAEALNIRFAFAADFFKEE